ncbi:hypothetical protein C3747_31g241 [Trypanosoma cruzi]|uniref:Uncharacterized protein n=2 Tax=Trypanosoma cruzi TaxID=5693 RepID=Q4DYE2_TRYCC|nr:hypothetical protein, conserved [Trypanosoma cruzi]EAN97549.1 hypothetical protein, conserved [Trypanosoma cruzi]KAF8299448.1 hypothetical protein TcYC6_0065320 [Trypanosoma cruzi]PWV15112.1 hypothetical protein C3747_31g241 [Trypanosoma cruzi]|eukprot:XP_819400.1 hypothetical protein [Trypanosoma cruzi strain CL Brener]
MLASLSRNEFGKVEFDFITCTICPAMKTIVMPTSGSTLEMRILLSNILGLTVESVEFYRKETKGFFPVLDESMGVGHYYVLLRIRGGKGGFRKQLEKKGRAFARARRLRGSNQMADHPTPKKGAEVDLSKETEDKERELTEKTSSGEEILQSNIVVICKIRDAVRIGVKRTIESLVCTGT